MPATRAYLTLRRRTLGRQLREVGGLRLAVLGFFLMLAGGKVLLVAEAYPAGCWAVPVGLLLLLASAHRQRADLPFLTMAAPDFRRWLAAEYALLALPVALVLLAIGAVGPAGLTLGLAPLAAWAGTARPDHATRRRARSLFRSEAFEWVSGMRAAWGGLVWLALLAGAVWQHSSPLGPGLALGAWLLVVLSCYGTPEPPTMLVLGGLTAEAVLRRRLLLGLGYAALTAAPLVWLLGCTEAGVGGALGVGVVWLLLLALLLLTKYAFYPNALQIRFTQALVLAVALTMFGDPVYLPLLAVTLGGLLWQSRRRLREYLGPRPENS
jgi:hypothetical protein